MSCFKLKSDSIGYFTQTSGLIIVLNSQLQSRSNWVFCGFKNKQ